MINILLTLLIIIIIFFIVYVGLLLAFNALVHILSTRNKIFSKRFYLKEIPLSLDYRTFTRTKSIGEFLGILLITAFIFFTILLNTTPFGVTVQYDMNNNDGNISSLGPTNRVQITIVNDQQVKKILNDLAYFTTNMPYMFDDATVKIFFKNNTSDQVFSAGFKDMRQWHYNTRYYDVPFLNSLPWKRNSNNSTFYQRKQTYTSLNTFLINPPHNSIIGTFNYTTDIGDSSKVHIPGYTPNSTETVIDSPLRGKQVMYVYLENEPLHMTIEKQDLNWYANPDTMTVNVYKDNKLIYHNIAADDGIADGSHQTQPPTDITIDSDNFDTKLSESGVYKIVIDANDDTIIKSIRTNLHKIVFANGIFLAANSAAYGPIVSSTSATTLYTNALSLSAFTYHVAGEQEIAVGNQLLNLNALQIPVSITPQDTLSKIIVPQNDVILNAFQGYFSFTPDQFFTPTNYYVMPITSKDDIAMVDYILTNYTPSHEENGWQVNEQTFDLHTAYVSKNRLSWVIEAPKLKENNGSLMIKDIQVTFHKKGWL